MSKLAKSLAFATAAALAAGIAYAQTSSQGTTAQGTTERPVQGTQGTGPGYGTPAPAPGSSTAAQPAPTPGVGSRTTGAASGAGGIQGDRATNQTDRRGTGAVGTDRGQAEVVARAPRSDRN